MFPMFPMFPFHSFSPCIFCDDLQVPFTTNDVLISAQIVALEHAVALAPACAGRGLGQCIFLQWS